MSGINTDSNKQSADKQVETVVSSVVINTNTSADMITNASVENILDTVTGTKDSITSTGVTNRNQAILTKDSAHIVTQIDNLRRWIVVVIPVEKALNHLTKLRYPSTTDDNPSIFLNYPSRDNNNYSSSPEAILNELTSIEAMISHEMETQSLLNLLQHLRAIRDKVNIRIAKLNFLFVSAVYPAISRREFVKSMMVRIGHRELCEEAEMHFDVICELVEKLDPKELINKDFDVLNDEAQAAVSVMTAIETRRRIVEELVALDRSKRSRKVTIVTGYILLITIGAILIPLVLKHFGLQLPSSEVSLNELTIPLLGIPWPVIIWSLIGSFAATIHRFNRMSIYDFNDIIKWMLTRHVQGVVLGSAFYLVLVSGLFLLTNSDSSEVSSPVKNEVILVLSFLIGFSDRFVDSVFDTLVDKYSRKDVKAEEDITNESSKKINFRRSQIKFRRYEQYITKPKSTSIAE